MPLKTSPRPCPKTVSGPHPVSKESITKAQTSCRLMDFTLGSPRVCYARSIMAEFDGRDKRSAPRGRFWGPLPCSLGMPQRFLVIKRLQAQVNHVHIAPVKPNRINISWDIEVVVPDVVATSPTYRRVVYSNEATGPGIRIQSQPTYTPIPIKQHQVRIVARAIVHPVGEVRSIAILLNREPRATVRREGAGLIQQVVVDGYLANGSPACVPDEAPEAMGGLTLSVTTATAALAPDASADLRVLAHPVLGDRGLRLATVYLIIKVDVDPGRDLVRACSAVARVGEIGVVHSASGTCVNLVGVAGVGTGSHLEVQ